MIVIIQTLKGELEETVRFNTISEVIHDEERLARKCAEAWGEHIFSKWTPKERRRFSGKLGYVQDIFDNANIRQFTFLVDGHEWDDGLLVRICWRGRV